MVIGIVAHGSKAVFGAFLSDVRFTPAEQTSARASSGPKSADIVAKVENRTTPKISQMLIFANSATAVFRSANTKLRDRFCAKRCGPSYRRARNASAVLKNFGRHPKKTFATMSANFGSGRTKSRGPAGPVEMAKPSACDLRPPHQ
jgi:hypothetical protein